MRKGIITLVLLAITTITFGQQYNIVNASIALKHAKEAKRDEINTKCIKLTIMYLNRGMRILIT